MIARFNGRENCAGRTLPWPRAVAVLLFFLVATSAPAADAAAPFLGTNSPALPPLPSSTSVVFSLFRVLGALALVLAVFFAGVWLFRNWQRTLAHKGQSPKLNILETKALGQRHALVVVGYEQQRFLVASSPAGVTMLATLPEGSPVVAEIKSTGTHFHRIVATRFAEARNEPFLPPSPTHVRSRKADVGTGGTSSCCAEAGRRLPSRPQAMLTPAAQPTITTPANATTLSTGLMPFRLNLGVEAAQQPQDVDVAIKVLFGITLLTLAPSIILLMTCFAHRDCVVLRAFHVQSTRHARQSNHHRALICS
ncbi:MAG: flagellar biosynthetic protein FliO [Verrucomicrobiota bacterium]